MPSHSPACPSLEPDEKRGFKGSIEDRRKIGFRYRLNPIKRNFYYIWLKAAILALVTPTGH